MLAMTGCLFYWGNSKQGKFTDKQDEVKSVCKNFVIGWLYENLEMIGNISIHTCRNWVYLVHFGTKL